MVVQMDATQAALKVVRWVVWMAGGRADPSVDQSGESAMSWVERTVAALVASWDETMVALWVVLWGEDSGSSHSSC